MSDYEEKFGSLARVYGDKLLAQIRNSHICIVGIGGVGSWAVEALARSSVGRLTLVDGDTISRSNTNRQIHTLESTLGKSKTEVMRARILDINPECDVQIIDSFINDDNLREILERKTDAKYYDGVIDAIDSIKMKAAMIYCCKRNKIPIVTTGGAGGLIDPTLVEIKDLTKTWNDPLAASVRSRLRFKYGYTRNTKRSFGVPCVFSSEQQRYPDAEGQPGYCKPGVAGLSLDCNFGYGSSVMVTASFGFAAASCAIDRILRERRLDQLKSNHREITMGDPVD
jgi:tRNA A37 threonylcarbamoyladenosine dehydratase